MCHSLFFFLLFFSLSLFIFFLSKFPVVLFIRHFIMLRHFLLQIKSCKIHPFCIQFRLEQFSSVSIETKEEKSIILLRLLFYRVFKTMHLSIDYQSVDRSVLDKFINHQPIIAQKTIFSILSVLFKYFFCCFANTRIGEWNADLLQNEYSTYGKIQNNFFES